MTSQEIQLRKAIYIALPISAFNSCASTIKVLVDFIGIDAVKVDLVLLLTDAEILLSFEQTFQTHEIKLAIFDAIGSLPAAKMPYEELTDLCRKHNVISVVDSAHSAGALPVDFVISANDSAHANWLNLLPGNRCHCQ